MLHRSQTVHFSSCLVGTVSSKTSLLAGMRLKLPFDVIKT